MTSRLQTLYSRCTFGCGSFCVIMLCSGRSTIAVNNALFLLCHPSLYLSSKSPPKIVQELHMSTQTTGNNNVKISEMAKKGLEETTHNLQEIWCQHPTKEKTLFFSSAGRTKVTIPIQYYSYIFKCWSLFCDICRNVWKPLTEQPKSLSQSMVAWWEDWPESKISFTGLPKNILQEQKKTNTALFVSSGKGKHGTSQGKVLLSGGE